MFSPLLLSTDDGLLAEKSIASSLLSPTGEGGLHFDIYGPGGNGKKSSPLLLPSIFGV